VAAYLASLLTQELGYTVTQGEAYPQCVFPGGVIPKSAWSVPATNLLKYIPAPNNANGTFSTSAYNKTLARR
jgi:hypothetical protein